MTIIQTNTHFNSLVIERWFLYLCLLPTLLLQTAWTQQHNYFEQNTCVDYSRWEIKVEFIFVKIENIDLIILVTEMGAILLCILQLKCFVLYSVMH